ncbi:uncharacterized protein CLUP02_07348, partial [Colletotrichum lupini]
VFLTNLLLTGLRHSIDTYYTDNSFRRLGGILRDIDIVNTTYIK